MTEEITCIARQLFRLVYDLYDIKTRRVTMPMSATAYQTQEFTAAQVAGQDWTVHSMPVADGQPDTDLTVTIEPYTYELHPGPTTRFTLAHDDRSLQGFDSLDAYGDQAEPVLRGILDGAYQVTRLQGIYGGDSLVVLTAEGLPDLSGMAEDGMQSSLSHSILFSPLDPGEHDDPKTGAVSYERDFSIRVQLTVGGHPISDDTDEDDDSTTLGQAVEIARMLAAKDSHPQPAAKPSDEELMAEIHQDEHFDYRMVTSWTLDSFKCGDSHLFRGGWESTVTAWVAMVERSTKLRTQIVYYTIIHAQGTGSDGMDDAYGTDTRWTIDRRLTRSQLKAIYPLLSTSATVTKTRDEVRP